MPVFPLFYWMKCTLKEKMMNKFLAGANSICASTRQLLLVSPSSAASPKRRFIYNRFRKYHIQIIYKIYAHKCHLFKCYPFGLFVFCLRYFFFIIFPISNNLMLKFLILKNWKFNLWINFNKIFIYLYH